MTGAFRYWHDLNCVLHWAWFPRVGRPELARAVQSCTRTLALAAPLLGPVLPAVVAPVGVTGPGAYEIPQTGAPVATNGWGASLGLSAGSPADANNPTSLTGASQGSSASAWANRAPRAIEPVRSGLPLAGGGANAGFPATSFRVDTTLSPQPPAGADVQIPVSAGDRVPAAVPEPWSVALLGVGLVVVGLLDRSGRG